MKENTSNSLYIAPQVDVVLCQVEQGFGVSQANIESPTRDDEQTWG